MSVRERAYRLHFDPDMFLGLFGLPGPLSNQRPPIRREGTNVIYRRPPTP